MAEAPVQMKEWFNEERYRWFADELAALSEGFDRQGFLAHVLTGIEQRELLQRLRATTVGLHRCMPGGYREHLDSLRRLAPRISHGFVGILPCDYVGCYGLGDFEGSMAALREFTCHGSGEFAVREYLRVDQDRALAIMLSWTSDSSEHVRRLASEGSRPRLPWSFRLEALVRDPRATRPILEALRSDPSLYVRKSVANHLNDISKDHPAYMLELLESWDLSDARSAWIAKHACRSLIKAGNPRALALFKVSAKARIAEPVFKLSRQRLAIGGSLELQATIQSTARSGQRLVVDFAVYYVRASGKSARKVFKWKFLELPASGTVQLSKKLVLIPRSTRTLYPGKHGVELLVNGQVLGQASFSLLQQS